jgi:hypothetical protein
MQQQNKWGQIDLANWLETPFIANRIAVEQDIIDGLAVFCVPEAIGKHYPINIPLPSLAYQIDPDTKEKTLVVVIQAESTDEGGIVGVRYLEGGNGICDLNELELIQNA